MSKFILSFYGGNKPNSEEEGAKHMEKYKTWLKNLGDAVVNPGMPLGTSKIISSDSIKDSDRVNPCSGISIVNADSIEAAIEIAKSCPFLETGGDN